MAPLSVSAELDGRCILITGGLGFLGSVCVEQLLRLTEVGKVYLLVRGKKHLKAHERVQKLLCGPLFHKLHAEAAEGGRNPFSRVHAVEGDLELPGLGLSPADREQLVCDVDVVIHAAASLTLDARIQDALRSNFLGTQALLQLCSEMAGLRSFVHVSTYWVNNFHPYNTPVKEEVHYPKLSLAGDLKALTARELADHLLAVDPDTAADEVQKIMARLNFVSTYAFSKLLTEQVVDDPATLPGVAKVIIRPSLISPMANDPYPGYAAGFAGAQGYTIAYGMGCFHDISSVAFASDALLDLIPVDTSAALTVAAAAAASAHGPFGEGRACVYHSTSAESFPHPAPAAFEKLHHYWTANPPPYALPFRRYPTYSGRHHPTTASMWRGTMITSLKVWAVAQLLKWCGKSRQAASLTNGFKAFCVQNTPGYARSIVSCVDNARELEASLVPAERDAWRCVWQEGPGMEWEDFFWTALTGGCSILLKMPESKVVGVRHRFVRKQGLSDPSVMQQWMATPTSSLNSSGSMSDEGSSTSCEGARVRVSVCPAGVSTKAAGVPVPAINISATPAL